MRNDYGTRWTPPRFKSEALHLKVKNKATMLDLMNLQEREEEKNLKALKLEEMNLKVWKNLWDVELMLLSRLWIKATEKDNELY